MTEIVKTNPSLDSHASAWQALWTQVRSHMQLVQAHPARTVVLLPFFQLQAVARASARQHWPSGFSPRLETTKSWSQRISHFVPSDLDIRFDAGLDSLRASSWLKQAGLGAKQGMLAGVLVDTAQQLGALVAAVPPAQRSAWAVQARLQVLQGLEANPLVYEAAVARIALEWALASRYASDVLFEPDVRADLDALVVVQGLQANPLAQALAAHWQAISSTAQWQAGPDPSDGGHITVHTADNAHDEADRAAACVLRHLGLGRSPVALAAVDRVSARRISATLQLHGVALADETGWKLSTTRAAAGVVALLRAARWQAHGEGMDDALLDWLKHTNAPSAQVDALERTFRQQNATLDQQNVAQAAIEFIVSKPSDDAAAAPATAPFTAPERQSVEAVLASLRRSRPVAQWLTSLQQTLRATGQWGTLVADAAGRDCLQALHLLQPDLLESYNLPMSLAEFSAWANDCLESGSFKPSAEEGASPAQVVVLPLAQVMARPFAAIVIAGADEQRLPAEPEPVGAWTTAQRTALGLPHRDALGAEQQAVWRSAMQVPQVDVLWRSMDGEQALQPSPLLQRWMLGQTSQGQVSQGLCAESAIDPRESVLCTAQPTSPPHPAVQGLKINRLSASSYSDLRTCPYRFFALRLLGLQEAPELDAEVDKRDFGSWLHAVLSDFHTRRQEMPASAVSGGTDIALIDQCAADQRMADSGFVPFAAAWPQVRSSYLAWLAQHEAEGWQFDQAELERTLAHDGITLNGRLDRVDRLSRGPEAGTAYVLDYKTESTQTSKERVKNPMEDTQLAFYAALLGEDDLHAAYVNIAERDCKITTQPEIMAARDALLSGITQDVQRIHAGHAMPALGEGNACDFCAARGLCRKDFWTL
jgi:ATP-dependent helicase/nuclease subunit B